MAEEAPGVDLKDIEHRMHGALDNLKSEFGGLRTGRASASLLDPVMVDAYGQKMPLNQVGTVSVPEPRMLLIKPFDPSTMGEIENAIRNSDLGVNPTNDGNIIRVILPSLTEERRRDYIKLARAKGEDAKISIRNIRRKAKEEIDKLVKDGEIGEDEGARGEKELEALTKNHTDQVETILKAKETELLEV